jgi:transketolase
MASHLCDHFPSLGLVSAPSLKPINEDQIREICKINDCLITLEEHSVIGGLGSILAEIAAPILDIEIQKIGIQDKFSEYCGTYEYLLGEHKIDFESVKAVIYKHL